MPLSKLQFRPGINKEITSYSNEGGWVDGDLVRFRFGYPEKIGGWAKYTQSTYLGTPRSLHAWVTLANDRYLSVGTNVKYYIESGGAYNDITPVRLTVRQPFDVSGVVGTTSVGTVTVANPLEITPTSVSATASVGTVTILTEPISTPLVGTTGLGNVIVVASDVDVPVGG